MLCGPVLFVTAFFQVVLTVSKAALDRERLGIDPCSQEMDDNYPMGPLVPCSYLPEEFIECNVPELSPAHNDSAVSFSACFFYLPFLPHAVDEEEL